jgi:hypothetical protein
MSRTFHHGERRIRVRAIKRREPDLRKLAGALIDLAQAQLETNAEHQHKQQHSKITELRPRKPSGPKKDAA